MTAQLFRLFRLFRLVCLATASLLVATASWAQDYPNRAVRIIVPFPAGGTADAVPRVIGDWLSRKWGQPVIIENHTGAGGNIGAELAFRADPDGYTLFATPPGPLAINQFLYPKLAYDPTQFEPIAIAVQVPNALMVNPNNVAAKSLPEFIAYLKANPGKATAANQGNGTTSHLTTEMFQIMAQVQVRHIPYRGSAPALQGLVAGDVDFMFDNLGSSLPLAEAGKLRLLAVASAARVPSLPNVPTLAETLPGFESAAWYAIVAPPKTPKSIVEKLNADVNEALRQREVQERFKRMSAEVTGGSTEAMLDYMRREMERWQQVIKAANVRMQ